MDPIVKAGAVYKHYKGNYYIVDYIAFHTETEEVMVIYHNYMDNKGSVWARPLSMWNEEVEYEGRKVTRFELKRGFSVEDVLKLFGDKLF